MFRQLIALSLALPLSAFAAGSVHEIKMKSVKEADGKTHWEPATVEVHPGEKVRFELTHEIPEGPAFHGFSIPALKVAKQVNRGEPLNVDVDIPADMKDGEYPITCQFHPAHVGAKLIVAAHGHEAHDATKPMGIDASKAKSNPLPPDEKHLGKEERGTKKVPGEPK